MKIKTTLIYHASYIMLAKVQKLDSTVCWQGCRETSMFAYLTLVLQYYIANVEKNLFNIDQIHYVNTSFL